MTLNAKGLAFKKLDIVNLLLEEQISICALKALKEHIGYTLKDSLHIHNTGQIVSMAKYY
jgi:hypothetical protein